MSGFRVEVIGLLVGLLFSCLVFWGIYGGVGWGGLSLIPSLVLSPLNQSSTCLSLSK